MSIQFIKSRFVPDIKADEALKLKIAQANGCKMSTVDRWLKTNDESLTTIKNLRILAEHFGVLEITELLDDRSLVA